MVPPDQGHHDDSSRKWIIGLAGCGFVLFLGLLAAVGAGMYIFSQGAEMVEEVPIDWGGGGGGGKPPTGTTEGGKPPRPQGPGGPAIPGGGLAPSSRAFTATVTRASGSGAGFLQGASCQFAVQRVGNPQAPGGYWCHTVVTCNGRTLYGSERNGFFSCTMGEGPSPNVVGGEDQTTGMDTDAAFRIDSTQGTMSLRDDEAGPFGAYSLEARLGGVI